MLTKRATPRRSDPTTAPPLMAIRKEKPIPIPRPPSRPPAPSGVNVPGGDAPHGGMVCPGTGGDGGRATAPVPARVPVLATRGAGAPDETLLESPAQKTLRKPSALGGKSIHVQVVEGEEKGHSFDITGLGTYVIGRRDCDIVLNDEKVSRKHASIIIAHEGHYAVQDLASKNGTFVNGVRLTRRNVAHNDLIRVGNTTLRFTVFDGPVPVQR
ncbi:MAG: FHA domain-containing protein [Candidatus Polarisedimenticolia bacterium]